MDSKDKIIKQLLEDNSQIKAPQDFTSEVMKSVMAIEEKKQFYFSLNTFMFSALIVFALMVSFLAFYFYDPELITKLISSISINIKALSFSLTNFINYITESFDSAKTLFSNSPIILPLVLGMSALILLERILSGFKTKINMLMSF